MEIICVRFGIWTVFGAALNGLWRICFSRATEFVSKKMAIVTADESDGGKMNCGLLTWTLSFYGHGAGFGDLNFSKDSLTAAFGCYGEQANECPFCQSCSALLTGSLTWLVSLPFLLHLAQQGRSACDSLTRPLRPTLPLRRPASTRAWVQQQQQQQLVSVSFLFVFWRTRVSCRSDKSRS